MDNEQRTMTLAPRAVDDQRRQLLPSAPPPYSERDHSESTDSVPPSSANSVPPSYVDSVPPPYTEVSDDELNPDYHRPIQVFVIQETPALPPLGSQTVVLVCPTCKERVTTKVQKETSNTAYRWCIWLFIVGCAVCSCVPFCMKQLKNYKHKCPECDAVIGIYQPYKN